MTPMRSVGHAKQLMNAFRLIEEEEQEHKAPKWKGTGSPEPYSGMHRVAVSGSDLQPIVRRVMEADQDREHTISAPLEN